MLDKAAIDHSAASNSLAPAIARVRATYLQDCAGIEQLIPTSPAMDPGVFGISLGQHHARVLDNLLRSLAVIVCDAQGLQTDPDKTGAFALAGVGGYGRGAVAFRSDLDVRILTLDDKRSNSIAESFLYSLWDMGIAIGHQVVTIDNLIEDARHDLPSATSLLDWRHVAGDQTLSDRLWQRAATGLFAPSELPFFIERLGREIGERHARFGSSVYLLEPDVKNGAGGLRDLDVARWAAKARYGVGDLDALVRVGALVAREATEIRSASDMLWQIRNLLHAHAGRRSDRFTFDEQEVCAHLLGYGTGGEAVERMMSAYYRTARTVARALDMMLTRSTPTLSRRRPHGEDLGSGVRLFDGCITFSDPELVRTDPALALRLLIVAVDRGVALLPYARDIIARACADPTFCAQLRSNQEAQRHFCQLVVTCKDTKLRGGSIMRELHDLGLLLAMIPEFLPVVGRVHQDVYHVYTVDVHSVAAVDRLVALVRGDLPEPFRFACRLAAEMTRPAMLFLATLLHDIGKSIGHTDHSDRGAHLAHTILERLGICPQDVDEACHLIVKHLLMYHMATRRDINDPATIAEFCRNVHGREGLRDLYLLTVADLSTTSPTSMTSWKARMLEELYLAADASLQADREGLGHVHRAAVDRRVARITADVMAIVDGQDVVEQPVATARSLHTKAFLASMPERYLLSNTPSAIAAHALLAMQHEQNGDDDVRVALVQSHPDAAQLCVIAADRPGLLAAVTAGLAASRLEVHAAQIHSRVLESNQVQAVDLFWVRDRGDGVEGVTRSIPKLVRDVQSILSGAFDGNDLVKQRHIVPKRDRAIHQVSTQISIDSRASSQHTVIDVVTRDRPGLLFTISDTLYRLGLSIDVAKINTEGTRVADVFYVREADGTKIAPGKRTLQVQSRIQQVLEGVPKEGSHS